MERISHIHRVLRAFLKVCYMCIPPRRNLDISPSLTQVSNLPCRMPSVAQHLSSLYHDGGSDDLSHYPHIELC